MRGGLVALGELGASALLYLSLLRRMRLAEAPLPTWWFGYARDAVNFVTMVLFTIGLHLFGFVLPSALLGAFFGTLLLYLLDWIVGWALRRRRSHQGRSAFLICSVVMLVALLAFGSAHRSAERAIDRLIRSALPRPPPTKT
jgi:predicted PurR-regulated permease PerM